MNLNIHVGMHKTGSSYLQTLFARNRDLLAEHSIYYSKSERDKEMLKGKISPGNALKLNKLLRDSKYEEVKKYLQQLVLQAEKINCKSVLLSNEGLFHVFAKEGMVSNFIEICKASGFKNIHGLVYFRDPVNHILSLYKHRAKSGKHSDFKVWLHEEYETFRLMESFLDYKDISGINWSCRLYKKNSKFMAMTSFGDWMNCKLPKLDIEERVNSSLTLSEIIIIQKLSKKDKVLTQNIYNDFSNLRNSEKAKEEDLLKIYINNIFEFISHYKNLLKNIDNLIVDNESLIQRKNNDSIKLELGKKISLSEKQIDILTSNLSKSSKMHYLIKIKNKFKRLF